MAGAGFKTTTIGETLPTEKIGMIIPPPEFARVYEQIAWIVNAEGATKWVFPSLDPGPEATGTVAENAEIPAEDFTTSSEEVTRSCIGKRALDSDANNLEGTIMTPEMKASALGNTIRNRVDRDTFALFGGATNSGVHTGVNLDLDIFDAEAALFRAQKPPGPRFVFCGSINQVRDLRTAIRQNGNGGLIIGAGLDLFNGMMRQGYQGNWGGFEIYEVNTTQADANNDSGGFVSCAPLGQVVNEQWQPFGGLGIAVWRGVRVVAPRRDERDATDYIGTIHFGVKITAEWLVREMITKKLAA